MSEWREAIESIAGSVRPTNSITIDEYASQKPCSRWMAGKELRLLVAAGLADSQLISRTWYFTLLTKPKRKET